MNLTESWARRRTIRCFTTGRSAFRRLRQCKLLVAYNPNAALWTERDGRLSRSEPHALYGLFAFYLWLQQQACVVHVGAHGSWNGLPANPSPVRGIVGPRRLICVPMPVIYSFHSVNDPGEAAQAKRRIRAVTVGNATAASCVETAEDFGRLERCSTNISTRRADPRGGDRLIADIRHEAQGRG